MNKQEWYDRGWNDAVNGAHQPPKPGTWMHSAYENGWQTRQDESAAPKAKVVGALVEIFRIGAGGGTKHQRRLEKRSAAFKRKMERKQRLAAADRDLRRKAGKYQSYGRDWVSNNIKRSSRGDRLSFDD